MVRRGVSRAVLPPERLRGRGARRLRRTASCGARRSAAPGRAGSRLWRRPAHGGVAPAGIPDAGAGPVHHPARPDAGARPAAGRRGHAPPALRGRQLRLGAQLLHLVRLLRARARELPGAGRDRAHPRPGRPVPDRPDEPRAGARQLEVLRDAGAGRPPRGDRGDRAPVRRGEPPDQQAHRGESARRAAANVLRERAYLSAGRGGHRPALGGSRGLLTLRQFQRRSLRA